jgi:hypothetical protein
MDDPGSTAPTEAEEALAARVARLAHDFVEASSEQMANAMERVADVVKRVRDALGALLGADGAPKPVQEMLERAGTVVADVAKALSMLLGARGPPGSDGQQLEEVSAAVAGLVQTLGEALGLLLPGRSDAPGPASNSVVLTRASYGLPERSIELLEHTVGTAMTKLAQATERALRAGGHAPAADNPVSPPTSPLPEAPQPETPSLPVPIAPSGAVSASASLLGASGSSGDLQLPFVILVLFSVALLQGGKFVCQQLEPLRPHSALRLAAERPG